MSTPRRALLALSLLAATRVALAQDFAPASPDELRFTSLYAVPRGVFATQDGPLRRFALVVEGDHLRLDELDARGRAARHDRVTLAPDGRLALELHHGLSLRREGAALHLTIHYCYERVEAWRTSR